MTDSDKGYKFKIELENVFFASDKNEDKRPRMNCTIYGNSTQEVLLYYNQLIEGLKRLNQNTDDMVNY